MLLVVTNRSDLACDFLIIRLKERGIPFTRLNTEDFGRKYHINLSVSKGTPDFTIAFEDGKALPRNAIDAVYFRQPLAPEPSDDLSEADRDFAKRELTEVLRSLWRIIDRDKWLNHPRDLWLASNKVEQLTIAASLGFYVPPILVTSDEQAARLFFEAYDSRVICKAVKHGFTRYRDVATVATTQRIDEEFFCRFADYAKVPMTFQREIPKTYDVRVTVVGEDIFATAIHSQQHIETEVDWRVWDVNDFELKHEPIELPEHLASLCRAITRHYHLRYSAIDLVLGRDGEFYFLEMNPNGQWAWIEQKAGYPIRDALIRCMGFHDATVPV